MPKPWRLAKALDTLRKQINAAHPKRGKASDGTIGNAEHSSRDSDHNPNPAGVVCALDITHDPVNGVDAGVLAEVIRASHDARIKYIISNARIASSYPAHGQPAWAWRPYKGKNAHRHHAHFSVIEAKADDTAAWTLPG